MPILGMATKNSAG
jgi:hypothetical protein